MTLHILMATGGAAHSKTALCFGGELARRIAAAVTIITAIKSETKRPWAETVLAQEREAVPQAHTKVELGHPVDVIIAEAAQGHYDLVLIGERPHHRLLTHFLMKSTTKQVVEHAPYSVLVVKGERGLPLRRILVCDSRVEQPSLISHLTTRLADLLVDAAEVTILHVMSQMSAGPGVRGQQLRASAENLIAQQTPEGKLLRRDLELLAPLGLGANPKVRHGLVVDEVLAEAHDGDYDLVVIGAHQAQGWPSFLLDNLAAQIITEIDRPVLVVRSERQGTAHP
jgi:nucleotide-binding universal stress UspA family protein